MSSTRAPRVTARQVQHARQIISKHYVAPIDWHANGISPNYLCADMSVSYRNAEALLLELEAEGFLYDNGKGGTLSLRRKDGTVVRNRFYPCAWLATMSDTQRAQWERQHAEDVEWDRREA